MRASRRALAVAVLSGLWVGAGNVDARQLRAPPRIEMSGVVVATTSDKLTIGRGVGGRDEATYRISDRTLLTIDGKPAKFSAVEKGMLATVELEDRESSLALAVRVAGQSVTGVVKAIDLARRTVRLEAPVPRGPLFEIGIDTPVTVDGKPGKLTQIRARDRVVLRLSADGRKVLGVTRLEVNKPRQETVLIKAVDTKELAITVPGASKRVDRAITLGSEVKVTINGKPAQLQDVQVGDQAVLTYAPVGRTVVAVAIDRRKRER
jgi:hypothetical protein